MFDKTTKSDKLTKGEQITQIGRSYKSLIRRHKLFTDIVGCYSLPNAQLPGKFRDELAS